MEELGNNKYECDDNIIYAPNYETAKLRCTNNKLETIKASIGMLKTTLWNKGYIKELESVKELETLVQDLKKFIGEPV